MDTQARKIEMTFSMFSLLRMTNGDLWNLH